PVVAAIGHETDSTLADEVADVRAATPSHAAQMVVPVLADLDAALRSALERGRWAIARGAQRARTRLEACGPGRAGGALPRPVEAVRRGLEDSARRLREALLGRMRVLRHAVDVGTRVLHALNPTAVLGRGFSLTWTGEGAEKRLVRDGST